MALTTARRDPSALADTHEYSGPPGLPSVVSRCSPVPSGAALQTFGPQRYTSASADAGAAPAARAATVTVATAASRRATIAAMCHARAAANPAEM